MFTLPQYNKNHAMIHYNERIRFAVFLRVSDKFMLWKYLLETIDLNNPAHDEAFWPNLLY